MSDLLKEITSRAMALSPVERAQLAEVMLESLQEGTCAEVDSAWDEQLQSRTATYERGEAKLVSAKDVFDEARIEFLAAVTYYEKIERRLGTQFRNAVEAASALAARLPNARAQWKHGTRPVFTKKRTLSSLLRSRISAGDQSIGMDGGAGANDVGYFVAGKYSNLTPYHYVAHLTEAACQQSG